MLLNASGQVFVAERLDAPGAWQMPQGGIDVDEAPFPAAVRELEEETGVRRASLLAESRGWLRYDLPEDLRQKVWKGRFKGQAQKWFAMAFDGEDSEIDLAGDHAEFSAWQWIAAVRLPSLIVEFKRPLYEAVLAEFQPVIERHTG